LPTPSWLVLEGEFNVRITDVLLSGIEKTPLIKFINDSHSDNKMEIEK